MAAARRYENRATFFGDLTRLADVLPSPPPANDQVPTAPAPTGKTCPEYKWIHVANTGVYRGHHQGEFELTAQTFATMVANLRRDPKYRNPQADVGPVVVDGAELSGPWSKVIQYDFEHASEMAPWEGSIPDKGVPAQGWVLDVEVRQLADGRAALFALSKILPLARHYIETEQYESVSIAWNPAGVHPVSGEAIGAVLTSIAFTNHPFVRDLAPIAAANRAAGQVPANVVQPRAQLAEAHEGGPPQPDRVEPMTPESRTRLCNIFHIMPAADDGSVIKAAENAATNGNDLAGLLKALGFTTAAEALPGVADLMKARVSLQELTAKLDSIMRGDEQADEAVAQQDVAAAFSAKRFADPSLVLGLTAHRNDAVAAEIKKLSAEKQKDVAEVRQARERGRQSFLFHYGVNTNPAQQHLTATFVAGPGAQGSHVQYPAPLPVPGYPQPMALGGRPLQLPPAGPAQGQTEAVDLSTFSGRNETEQIISYLSSKDPKFREQSWGVQVSRASQWRKAHRQAA